MAIFPSGFGKFRQQTRTITLVGSFMVTSGDGVTVRVDIFEKVFETPGETPIELVLALVAEGTCNGLVVAGVALAIDLSI